MRVLFGLVLLSFASCFSLPKTIVEIEDGIDPSIPATLFQRFSEHGVYTSDNGPNIFRDLVKRDLTASGLTISNGTGKLHHKDNDYTTLCWDYKMIVKKDEVKMWMEIRVSFEHQPHLVTDEERAECEMWCRAPIMKYRVTEAFISVAHFSDQTCN